ncbi:autotransporter assembly complex protein TamA [Marimonas arenosa]|uniref:Autotransporter assembly complex protein TamA n=1 Tax=Marimonas arenosa TaxID=1795305 RepID=A0AAE4B766_9RHOB|nr:autotransporter assembly complex family protein [Marimonas arenosa]MDQ2091146.1 autotransporter assembly complex protein TamA [Marimonas arenosa]
MLVTADPSEAVDRIELRVAGDASGTLQDLIGANSVLKGLEGRRDALPEEIIAAARSDYARILEVLYAEGYYSVVVNILLDGREAALIDPLNPPARMGGAVIAVDPGRLFRFGKLRLAPLARGNPMPGVFAPDAPASATVVRDVAQAGVRDWREAGYAKARISQQAVTARHGLALLDVDLAIAPGPRVRFGDTVVTGETKVRERNIRRIAGLPSGAVYSPEVAEKAGARLRKTGAFKSVQVIEAEQVAPDGRMDVNIAVVDQKPRRIGGGVEFSSFDGVTVSGYWLHRNLLGGAERFRVDAEIAQIDNTANGIDYSLTFRLEKPAVYGPDTLFFAEAGAYYLDEPDFLEEKAELTFGVSRMFNDRLSGELGIGFNFLRITDRYAVPETTRELRVVSFPTALTFDTRDDPLNAGQGVYLRADLAPFFETTQSQAALHLKVDGRTYRRLGGSGTTVAAGRVQLGALFGLSATSAPPEALFYSGGGGTVRGQPYKSLAADYGGVTLGGRSFAALSGELRFPVSRRFGLVAFADAGFVSGGLFDNGDWHAGAGLGVRYRTPVGPIRFDVAGPVAGSTGSGVQFYVGIGQAF